MQAWSKNPRLGRQAFTLIELLIVLSILIGISAIVLPTLLVRGRADQRADLELRLGSALLDAQREARRIGQTVEVRWEQTPGQSESTVVIQTMNGSPNQSGQGTTDWATPDEGLHPEDFLPEQDPTDSVAESAQDPEGDVTRVVLAYAMPDGTVITGETAAAVEIDRQIYDLSIDAGTLEASLSPQREPSGADERDDRAQPEGDRP